MTTYKRPTFFDRDLKAFAELSSASVDSLGLELNALKLTSLSTGVVKSSADGEFSSALIQNADVASDAAIAYSKLDLALSIVNADVSETAAIAGTKISPDFGAQNVTTTGTLEAGAATLASATLGSSGSTVASIDGSGNASFDGTLTVDGQSTLNGGAIVGTTGAAGVVSVRDASDVETISLNGSTKAATIGNITIDGLGDADHAKISGLLTASVTAEGDAATKGYVDAVAQGLVIKAACHVSSQANIADLATATVVDGHTLLEDERVLVRFQNSAIENGIYRFNGTGLVRAADMAVGSHAAGSFTFIQFGTNEDSGFVCTADAPTDVVGTDALPWVQFSSAGVIEAGDGLQKIGNTISVKLDGSTLSVSPDGSKVLGVPALFTIDGTAVGSSVVASALDTLTLGAASNANALHSHSADAEYLPPAVGLAAGQAAIINASSEAEAAGTTSTGAYMVGVVESIADGFARIVRGGLAAGVLTSATAGDVYYVQADGTLAVTLPASGRVVMAGVAKSATDLHVQVRDFGNILA